MQINRTNEGQIINMISEPEDHEILRVRWGALANKEAVEFAYCLEALHNVPPNYDFTANEYAPPFIHRHDFYSRLVPYPDSFSLGMIWTALDKKELTNTKFNSPVLLQFGPKRRALAIAQRAEFWLDNNEPEVFTAQAEVGKGITPRSGIKSPMLDELFKTRTDAISYKEIGYRKSSSQHITSRTYTARYGLFNKIAGMPRSILGFGSMPAVSGQRDVVVTALAGYHPVFIHRNSIFAGYPQRRIDFINNIYGVLVSLYGKYAGNYMSNLGAALGCSNVDAQVEEAKQLYEQAGVRMFRIYTINSDPRVIQTAEALRTTFGDTVKIFVGQIADIDQAKELISPKIMVDGLVIGHGGGRQCTSATNGMAITDLELLYELTTDKRFNNTSIVVEGGVGTNIGPILAMGADLILYNQQLARGIIEQSDIYLKHRNGNLVMPYHGSASVQTMLIESYNPDILARRTKLSGRFLNVEGVGGYRRFERKANSMVYYLDVFKHLAARTLADYGARNFKEFRALLPTASDRLRRVSHMAHIIAEPYR